MIPFDLREPMSAMSHGAGMMMALPITWVLWHKCGKVDPCALAQVCRTGNRCGPAKGRCTVARHHRLKAISLVLFGLSLTFCYAASALFHGLPLRGPYQRLDHIGIYLLIAGTYTPIVWALLRGVWRWGTLVTVWTIALSSVARIWFDGVFPVWLATLTYLAMGWGSLFCYRQMARTYSHRQLLPLPLGGVLYSIGAAINLARWPILVPGAFGSHELFHLFVIAGSACHVFFMMQIVVPAPWPGICTVAARTQARPGLFGRWVRAMLSRRIRRWMLMLPHPTWLDDFLATDPLEGLPADGHAEAV